MSDSIKIFDCSNSTERPMNRGFGGPVENTIVRDLKKYASLYGYAFVDDIDDANIIFTNDVFTRDAEIRALDFGVPIVKRMDGVFFQDALRSRNESLNLAAQQADLVIFISEFSRDAYNALYGKLQPVINQCVILNWVDDAVFKFEDHSFQTTPERFVAAATSWNREEKRLNAIIELAHKNPSKEFHLIGDTSKLDIALPTNVFGVGYIEDESMLCDILGDMDAMICTAFRDAAPKTVAQGLAVGLPVFYANSGGVPELVRSNGLSFGIRDMHKFYDKIPAAYGHILAFDIFCDEYSQIVKYMNHKSNRLENRYQYVICSYFEQFSRLL